MPQSSRPKVNKLFRVLVAGGVALAGVAGAARAEDKPAVEGEKAQPADKAADKAAEQARAKQQREKEKARAKTEAEKAQSDGGGVKGW